MSDISSLISLQRRAWLRAAGVGAAALALPTLSLAQDNGPIRIGILAPLSGGGGAYGAGMANAARKAADYINSQAGGLLGGRKIEILVEDDESNPTAGVAAARKLLDVSKVNAIVGVWSSAVAMAVKPLTIERGVPLFVTGSGDEVTQGDNKGLVWRFQARGSDWGTVFARAAAKDGAHKASLLVLQTPFTLSMVDPFVNTFKKSGGQILDVVYYNPNQPSYRAEVEKVFARKPDAVFIPSYLPDLSAISREVYRSGFSDTRLYANSSAADAEGAFIKNVGKQVAEGIHHIQSIPPASSTAYKTFAREAGIPSGTLAIFPSNVWDEISVLALAIEGAGSADPKVFAKAILPVVNGPGKAVENPVDGLKAIRAKQAIAYSGAGSQFQFTPTGDQLNREYGHFVIRDGANHLVDVLK
ncbi:ABC transporter, substrate-binding protein (cluster 4, leucine/isoleucine/valine/benzoate) (plasmid) [Cupriavidus sp. U2]|uniref:ABC transporter substrate-binding protein n=1 Tax=Cupriavidus sp. U2 TaxID=2920269 RepID=UPI00129DB2F7|nr:ABC transporter substrate-binding protein [Cupriavidus sp. U2]KAI3592078.1 ABC transporter, substrate-binding protein (cluster 4, leucine/isoleucine/valine/benzoate) [Cupriavidus sp. U2]